MGVALFSGAKIHTQLQRLYAQTDGADIIVVTNIEDSDKSGAQARKKCLEYIAPTLHVGDGVSLFVFDKLESNVAMRSDVNTFGELRKNAQLGANVALAHARPSEEPLLGLPDLLAWSFRQKFIGKDGLWFQSFEEVTRIHEI